MGRKLNRSPKHRKAMIRTMLTQLVTHERIKTTYAKAHELTKHVEKMMSKGKLRIYSLVC